MKSSFTRFIAYKAVRIIKPAIFAFLFVSLFYTGRAQSTITFTLVKQPCNNDGVLVATVSSGTPPITFNWYGGPTTVTHISNGLTDTLFNYSGSMEYVSAFNNNLQASAQYAGSPPFKDTVVTTSAVCPALGTATVAIKGGKAPFTYKWIDINNVVVSTTNPASLPGGTYGVVITDSAGCVFGSFGTKQSGTYGGVYIQNVTSIAFSVDTTNAKCTNGTAKVVNVTGGKPPYSYKWSNGANTAAVSGLIMGNYSVTVTDSLGCYNIKYVYINQSPAIKVTTKVTNATCLQNDGAMIAFGSGGKNPYTFLWGNGRTNDTIKNLIAGYYTVTVTDANQCIGTYGSSVTAATPITVTYSATASACTAPTGTATLNITGGKKPYSVKWFTYPAQTGITASGLPPGQYGFTVTDSSGCVRTGAAYIPPVSAVTAQPSETDASCTQSDGSASVLVLTGLPPYFYVWNTGATTSSVSNLISGVYSVTITDKYSCTVTKYITVHKASPISLSLTPTSATCLFTANGSVTTNITGGTSPYTYSWSNGQSASSATGLIKGQYYLHVQDAAGCVQDAKTDVSYNTANDSCYCTVKGKVYLDGNSNCTYDQGETTIPNIMLHLSGMGYAFTASNGVYTFLAPTGSYTLSENVQAYYPLASCQNNSVSVTVTAASGCVISEDFANIINPIHDVSITTTRVDPPILGHTYSQKLIIQNNGTITENDIQLGYAHDGQLFFTGETPSLFIQQNAGSFPNWYSITSAFPSLSPGATQSFDVTYTVPTNIPLGTSVIFNDTTAYASPMSNWLLDYSPWDNVGSYTDIVVGSFDPNDKEVSPKGIGAQGVIPVDDSVITYTVHFQNTGTYSAQKVVVIDTLDPNLDVTTLKPGYSNHNYTTAVSDKGAAIFTFDNINLPDSIGQPLASIGVLQYSAHLKKGLVGGTKIKSPASVYFDYNAPVKTNTALNTIEVATDIKNTVKHNMEVMLFPNPAHNNVSVAVNALEANANSSLKFYNVLGQMVKSESISLVKGKNLVTSSLGNLPEGIYFVEVTEGKNTSMQKLNIAR